MKLFVTGGSGMVGRNVLENNPDPNQFEILTKPSSELNLLEYKAVREYLEEAAPDLIVHCAGKVGGIQANMRSPYDFCFDNLQMGMNLVRAAKELGIRKFINLSSSCAAVIKKIHQAKVANSNEVVIWGDGLARREFMYCGDLAHCIFQAVQRFDSLPLVMNVGIGTDHTINDYYAVIKEIVGFDGRFVHDLEKPVGMSQKLLDVSRQKEWGWAPRTSLADGVQKTYDYFQKEA